MTAADTHRAIETVWRIESPRLIAGLTRFVRDVGAAEDLAHDALVAALEQWPSEGVPRNPGAWLMTTAKRRAIDRFRRRQHAERSADQLSYEITAAHDGSMPGAADLDDDVGDDLLRLMFMTCHPVLPTDGRVALTLRLLGGLTTDEIARAFLVAEPTIAQRIVRAKKTLAAKQVPFELPHGPEREARVSSLLDVLYLIFNEGYTATAGGDWMRPALCEQAMRLGRVLVGLTPREAEAHGLIALLELQASRIRARVGPGGEPILLTDQNRALWDRLLIRRGLQALATAEALSPARGRYTLQAAIAACHAQARSTASTDWTRVASLYGELARVAPSPVIELNRAVAVGMADGAAAGLALVERLQDDPALQGYHLLPAVRGDLLARLGRGAEASRAFEHAATLTRNRREQSLLRARARDAERRA